MISREEKLRLKMLITDTVLLLCKNGLVPKLKGEFSIEGLIGISLQDEEDLMLVSFNERLKGEIQSEPALQSYSETESETNQRADTRRHKKRKRKHRKQEDETNGDVSPSKSAALDVQPDTESHHLSDDIATCTATTATSPNTNTGQRFVGNTTQDIVDIHEKHSTQGSEGSTEAVETQHAEVGNNDLLDIEPNDSKSTMKLESCSEDELILIKHEMLSPGLTSITSHQEMGPFVAGTQITGIVQNEAAFPTGEIATPPGLFQSKSLPPDAQHQQVELLPGSGVYISLMAYQQLQYIDKGTKLVRKLVREVFPDVHVLANSSCKGRGTSGGLDQHKVEVIKEFALQRDPTADEALLLDTINHVCIESRRLIRARAARSWKKHSSSPQPVAGGLSMSS